MTALTANEVFRDYETDGVPASGAHKPVKADIREYLTDKIDNIASPYTPASALVAAKLDLDEATGNGTSHISITAPVSIASDKTATLQDVTGTLYVTGGQDVSMADGGTGASLTDPNADRVLFWDDSAGQMTWLTMGTGLTITGTTLDSAGGASMTLLSTLTTTSGTTQSFTSIPAGYRELRCELEGVSFSGTSQLKIELSSTGGAGYGAVVNLVQSALTAAGNTLNGVVRINTIWATTLTGRVINADIAEFDGSSFSTSKGSSSAPPTNTAAALNAVRFSGGTFDAGTIRIYGVK